METYCQYINQSGNNESRKWMQDNQEKINAFGDWLKTLSF